MIWLIRRRLVVAVAGIVELSTIFAIRLRLLNFLTIRLLGANVHLLWDYVWRLPGSRLL
jgi:hypothetical protein